jgi:hypothetical protein
MNRIRSNRTADQEDVSNNSRTPLLFVALPPTLYPADNMSIAKELFTANVVSSPKTLLVNLDNFEAR